MAGATEQARRRRLAALDPVYREALERHRAYDAELQELLARRYLTSDEQFRVKELKKLKLLMKDRMEEARCRLKREGRI